MLERQCIELAPFAREFARQQFEIQECERAAKVEQQRLEFFLCLRFHSVPAEQGPAPAPMSGKPNISRSSVRPCRAAIRQKDMIFLEFSPRRTSAPQET